MPLRLLSTAGRALGGGSLAQSRLMPNASMAAVMGVALHSSPHGHNPSTSTPSSTSSTGPPQTAHASSLTLNLYPGGVALLGVAATAAAVSAQSAPTAADVSRRMGLAPLGTGRRLCLFRAVCVLPSRYAFSFGAVRCQGFETAPAAR